MSDRERVEREIELQEGQYAPLVLADFKDLYERASDKRGLCRHWLRIYFGGFTYEQHTT